MIPLLVFTGFFLTLKTGFIQLKTKSILSKTLWTLFTKKQKAPTAEYESKNNCTRFSKSYHDKSICSSKSSKTGVSPFAAVSTALAGTIGTGSIAGISSAIIAGGPGAVFWMWISAFFGMVTKYSEILLSIKYRKKDSSGKYFGGPMFYIQNGLNSKLLASLFCVFCMFACLGIGNSVQSNSIADVFQKSELGLPRNITGYILSGLTAVVIMGGIKRISKTNEKMVPIMALFYILSAIFALTVNYHNTFNAFTSIFKEAFNIKSAICGGLGYSVSQSMKSGFAKGVFSNEAGLGSAPIAHASANTDSAPAQALWGIFEVFVSTICICTLSALVVLSAGIWEISPSNGSALCIASFNELIPGLGMVVVMPSTLLFALSTIFGWAYYGEVAALYLFKNKKSAVHIYRIIYVMVVYIGAISSMKTVWHFSELMNAMMALPNIVALIFMSNEIRECSAGFFGKGK